MKNFQLLIPSLSLQSSIPISFPSLTHLSILMDPCLPTTSVSHLLLLKSLTHLRLIINNCVEPVLTLMALQPLASVLTQLDLNIESPPATISRSSDSGPQNDDKPNGYNGYQILTSLLPFRLLTDLSIFIAPRPTSMCYYTEITNSFIRQQWNKLERLSISLCSSPLLLTHLLRDFLSLTLLPPTDLAMRTQENDSLLLFEIALWNVSLEGLATVLSHMENASLLLPPSASKPTYVPTISLSCVVGYGQGEAEALRIQSLQCDMTDSVKSRGYTNMTSFTVRAILSS
jgi:hypothetical protein